MYTSIHKTKISKTERGLSIEHICERLIFFICIYQNIMLQSIKKFDLLYIHKICTYALDLDLTHNNIITKH